MLRPTPSYGRVTLGSLTSRASKIKFLYPVIPRPSADSVLPTRRHGGPRKTPRKMGSRVFRGPSPHHRPTGHRSRVDRRAALHLRVTQGRAVPRPLFRGDPRIPSVVRPKSEKGWTRARDRPSGPGPTRRTRTRG